MRTGRIRRIRRTLWVVLLLLLLLLGVQAQVQENTALMMRGDGTLLPTNAAQMISNALGLGPFATSTSLEITNITGLQGALNGKLATNGIAQAATIITNSVTGERVLLEGGGGRLSFYANQNQDPFIWLVALPKVGENYPTYMSIGVRNGQGFLATGNNGPLGPNSVRIEKYGGGLTKLEARELSLSGGGINAAQATGTGASDVANVGTLDARYAKKETFAVFDIPLGDSYTDFELKASTSNFATNSTYTNGMVFFYHSPDPGKSAIPEQIWSTRPDVFFTDSAWTGATNYMNQRSWRKQSASQSIAAMRAGGVNSVIAGVVVVVRDTGVISPTNAALVWSYCRYTPTAYEADGGGRSIWMPITPKWVAQPFVP